MAEQSRRPASRTAFHITPPHPCSYLPEQRAATLFADAVVPMNNGLYSALLANGFRRSGEYLYRPQCPACRACVPVRVAIDSFRPNRNQRRTWLHNQDLEVRPAAPAFTMDHYSLYRRYVSARHPGGDMEDLTPERFINFLAARWANTLFYEFRRGIDLVAVAAVDRIDDALSAVYTFFDTDEERRSLGRYAVLYEIEQARTEGLRWLYLGYWIDACRKMRYKAEFQPLEYYCNGRWTPSAKSI
ncbi:MAG: arginyltransferase [Chromatiales bacterium]